MAVYEYYCKSCDDKFEVLKPMAKVQSLEVCPEGHKGAAKVLSVFASVSSGGTSGEACGMDASACCGSNAACNMN